MNDDEDNNKEMNMYESIMQGLKDAIDDANGDIILPRDFLENDEARPE